jgi:metal-responsive CopG/Arc/MetJ family transcriptional regulator
MEPKNNRTSMTIPKVLANEIDGFIARNPSYPSRSAVTVYAIRRLLDGEEIKEAVKYSMEAQNGSTKQIQSS